MTTKRLSWLRTSPVFVLVIILIVNYTVEDMINTFISITSLSFFIGATAIILLVFVPKVTSSLVILRFISSLHVFVKCKIRVLCCGHLSRSNVSFQFTLNTSGYCSCFIIIGLPLSP